MEQRTPLDELRSRIAEGRYEVDPALVADAIIRRRSSLAAAERAGARQASGSRRRQVAAIRRVEDRRSQGPVQRLAA